MPQPTFPTYADQRAYSTSPYLYSPGLLMVAPEMQQYRNARAQQSEQMNVWMMGQQQPWMPSADATAAYDGAQQLYQQQQHQQHQQQHPMYNNYVMDNRMFGQHGMAAGKEEGGELSCMDSVQGLLELPTRRHKHDVTYVKYDKYDFVGLSNLGNTCYLNSLLQSLLLSSAFCTNLFRFVPSRSSLKSQGRQEGGKVSEEMLIEMKKLFARLLLTREGYLSPTAFLHSLPPEYQTGQQQDVTEAARHVLEALGGQEEALVKLVFGGVLVQRVQCRTCGRVSERQEACQDFAFPVPSESFVEEQVKENRKFKLPSVQQYFDTYIKKEQLVGDNMYMCDNCNSKREALKWNEILSPPAYLLLILNRYSWSLYSNEKKKIPTHVDVDQFITVCQYKYVLYAAVMHAGNSANSGHYYAIGRRAEPLGKQWYKFDDSVVTQVDKNEINRISKDKRTDHVPYVLFYRCTQAPAEPPHVEMSQRLYRTVKKMRGDDR
eukprot:GHVS01008052.1.p1 GENE.GHVS01008052.1~~GHVS01008052.1.p1  ORF type:complete len:534 (+),score=135.84 GHVS01008052.1:134-1603(+)